MKKPTSDSLGIQWALSAFLLTAGLMVGGSQYVLAAEPSEGTLQNELAERDAAIEAGILERADQNARRVIEGLLLELGYERVLFIAPAES